MGEAAPVEGSPLPRAPDRVHLLVTGFGKFAGVPTNPTELLVNNLEAFLASSSCARPLQSNACVRSCKVLKVSASSVKEHLGSLAAGLDGELGVGDGDVVILVHFGVDVSATRFKLERQAYNEANFRLPDEDGWQPAHEEIAPSAQGAPGVVATRLDVDVVAQRLRDAGFDVAVSRDPGRYVCNYTYYKSQMAFGSRRDFYSIFVHVPTLASIDANTQMEFAAALLDQLAFDACLKRLRC